MMFRKMLVLLFIFIIVTAISSPAIITAQPASNPYIFYFSHDLKAFVIERADGADSRTLGEGILELSSPYSFSFLTGGPGWSPSGEWLAFSAAEGSSYNVSDAKPYLIKGDGTRTFPIAGLVNAAIAWSPTRDVLLVTQQWVQYDNGRVLTEVALLDPANNKRITLKPETTVAGDGRWQPYTAQWFDDHRAIAQYFAGATDSVVKTAFLVIDLNGTSTEKIFERVVAANPNISATGNIAYMAGDTLVIENLFTGKRFAVAQKFPTGVGIYWSPDGRYGVLIERDSWLLDVRQEKLTLLRSPYLAGEYTQPNWSPDSRHVVFYSDNALYHTSVESGATRPIALYPQGFMYYPTWRWSAAATLHSLEITDEEPKRLVLRNYNFQADRRERFEIPFDEADVWYSISPDQQSLAWVGDAGVVVDIATESVRYVSPPFEGLNSGLSGEIVWSPDSEWLLVFDNSVIAGGGAYRQVSIARKDGTQRRRVTFADGWQPNYYGFLPPQVDIARLPPAKPKPVTPKPFQRLMGAGDWILYLSWSPDGEQIIGGLPAFYAMHGKSPLWRWDVRTGNASLAFERVDNEQSIAWKRTLEGKFVPEVIDKSPRDPIAISADGSYRIKHGHSVEVSDKTGKVIVTLQESHEVWACAAFSPDGRWLATSIDGETLIRDTKTWQIVRRLPEGTYALAFSPDGQTLAAGNGWDIDLWKVADLVAP